MPDGSRLQNPDQVIHLPLKWSLKPSPSPFNPRPPREDRASPRPDSEKPALGEGGRARRSYGGPDPDSLSMPPFQSSFVEDSYFLFALPK